MRLRNLSKFFFKKTKALLDKLKRKKLKLNKLNRFVDRRLNRIFQMEQIEKTLVHDRLAAFLVENAKSFKACKVKTNEATSNSEVDAGAKETEATSNSEVDAGAKETEAAGSVEGDEKTQVDEDPIEIREEYITSGGYLLERHPRLNPNARNKKYKAYVSANPTYERMLELFGNHLLKEEKDGTLYVLAFHAFSAKPEHIKSLYYTDGWKPSGARSSFYRPGVYVGDVNFVAANYLQNKEDTRPRVLMACVVKMKMPHIATAKEISKNKTLLKEADDASAVATSAPSIMKEAPRRCTVAARKKGVSLDNTFVPCEKDELNKAVGFEACCHDPRHYPVPVGLVHGYDPNDTHCATLSGTKVRTRSFAAAAHMVACVSGAARRAVEKMKAQAVKEKVEEAKEADELSVDADEIVVTVGESGNDSDSAESQQENIATQDGVRSNSTVFGDVACNQGPCNVALPEELVATKL